jgi:hypothetical protein
MLDPKSYGFGRPSLSLYSFPTDGWKMLSAMTVESTATVVELEFQIQDFQQDGWPQDSVPAFHVNSHSSFDGDTGSLLVLRILRYFGFHTLGGTIYVEASTLSL